MPRIADYSIIADSWVLEKNQNSISFNVSSTIHTGSAAVLGFMLSAGNTDDMSLTVKLNGTQVWDWKYSDGKRVQFFQEVIGAGVVKGGANTLSFASSSDDFTSVQLSDIVLWFQADI